MRITTVLLFVAAIHVCGKGISQNVTFKKNNVTLKKALESIMQQTGYAIFGDQSLLNKAPNINLSLQNATIPQALDECLKGLPFTYEIKSKFIYIKPRTIVNTIPSDSSRAQITLPVQYNVQGRVIDSAGKSLSGVTVTIKGTDKGTYSDDDGRFSFKGLDNNDITLVFSYIGYKTQQVALNANTQSNQAFLSVVLKQNTNDLENTDVQVNTGYQSVPRERSTGSFVSISNKELNRQVGPNIMDKLYHITSGLSFNPSTTLVKPGLNVEVRGLSTINGLASPLIVVDNYPYDGNINDINPNDVASVTVLKDAAAASIWGVRAGNGVIVITTKQGAFNRSPTVSFNTNFTIGNKPDLNYIKTISSADEIGAEETLFNQGYYNIYDDFYPTIKYFNAILPQVAELLLAVRRGDMTQAAADAQIAVYKNHNVKDDYSKYMLQKEFQQQYNVNISGGSNVYSYYASVGYDQGKTNYVGQSNNRISIDWNNTFKPIKNLEINALINYTQSENWNNYVPFSLTSVAPYTMLADAQGNPLAIPYQLRTAFVDTATGPGLLDWHYRPLQEQKYLNNVGHTYNVRFNTSAKYNIISGLNLNVTYQYEKDLSNTDNNQSDSLFYVRNLINTFTVTNPANGLPLHQVPVGNIYDYSNGNQTFWNARAQLNLNKIWGDHQVDAIAGIERRETKMQSTSGRLYGFIPDYDGSTQVNYSTTLPTYFDKTMAIPSNSGLGQSDYRYGSYFANAAYTYKTRYTFTASGRIDQSNFFGVKANQRLEPLWSVGAAWDISREKFYNVSWVPYLKLRLTNGYNGNIGNNTTAFATAQYSTGNGISPTIPIATLISPNNPDLTWEKIRITNLAVEAASKNERISGSFEYYLKKGTNLIGPVNVDPTSGVLSFTGNSSSITGKGFDITINTRNLVGKFTWDTKILFSYNTDKVTSYNQPGTLVSAYYASTSTPVVGKPLNKLYSFKWAGLDPKTGDPRVYLGDTISNYNNINNAKLSDLVYSGPSLPQYFGSMMNNFSYGAFALSFNIAYKFDFYFRRSSIDYNSLFFDATGTADFAQRWQKPGDEKITNVPSMPQSVSNVRDEAYEDANILVTNGAFVRLQDIRLDYDLMRNKKNSRLPFKDLNLYLYVNNVGILWRANKYGIDPEAYYYGATPVPRTYSLGLTANF